VVFPVRIEPNSLSPIVRFRQVLKPRRNYFGSEGFEDLPVSAIVVEVENGLLDLFLRLFRLLRRDGDFCPWQIAPFATP